MSESKIKKDKSALKSEGNLAELKPDRLPIFYKTPEVLTPDSHADVTIAKGDFSFAEGAPCVPLLHSEFSEASCHYPILFAAGTAAPIGLLGLENRNLMVSDGEWDARAYLPAYVRRYPFTTVRLKEDRGFVLVLDTSSAQMSHLPDNPETAIFDDGKPSDYARRILRFCEAFHFDALKTEAFSKALLEKGLLTDRRVDATLPSGEKMGVNGFMVVDETKLAALDDATIADWHKKGWLSLITWHLGSLSRLQNLLNLQTRDRKAA